MALWGISKKTPPPLVPIQRQLGIRSQKSSTCVPSRALPFRIQEQPVACVAQALEGVKAFQPFVGNLQGLSHLPWHCSNEIQEPLRQKDAVTGFAGAVGEVTIQFPLKVLRSELLQVSHALAHTRQPRIQHLVSSNQASVLSKSRTRRTTCKSQMRRSSEHSHVAPYASDPT